MRLRRADELCYMKLVKANRELNFCSFDSEQIFFRKSVRINSFFNNLRLFVEFFNFSSRKTFNFGSRIYFWFLTFIFEVLFRPDNDICFWFQHFSFDSRLRKDWRGSTLLFMRVWLTFMNQSFTARRITSRNLR